MFALAGRQKVTPIMFIGNHMIYRDIIANDMKIRVEAPDDIKDYILKNESFSRSGDKCKGEGGDYIMKMRTNIYKSHLSPGVPKLKHWIEAAGNHKTLTANREMLFARLNIKDPGKEESSIFNHSHRKRKDSLAIRAVQLDFFHLS